MSHPPLSTQLFRIIIPVTGRPPPSFDRYGTRRSRGVTVPAVPLRSVIRDCADSGPCRDITDHAHGAATPERSRSRSLHSWPRLWRTSAARSSTRHVLKGVRGRAPPARRAHAEPVQDRARPVAPSVNARATQPPSETVRAETFSRPPERRGTPPVRGPVARRRAGRRPAATKRPPWFEAAPARSTETNLPPLARSGGSRLFASGGPQALSPPGDRRGRRALRALGTALKACPPARGRTPAPGGPPRAGGATAAVSRTHLPAGAPMPPSPVRPHARDPARGTKRSSPWRSAVHAARRGRIDGS
ncbi:hypothetical protein SUDANB13_02756 [Streptomyces sp. enrichment culture]